MKGNFTPAPVVTSDQPHVPAALKELVQLMQGYVDTVKDHDNIHITVMGGLPNLSIL